jgi:hypothetical protein
MMSSSNNSLPSADYPNSTRIEQHLPSSGQMNRNNPNRHNGHRHQGQKQSNSDQVPDIPSPTDVLSALESNHQVNIKYNSIFYAVQAGSFYCYVGIPTGRIGANDQRVGSRK